MENPNQHLLLCFEHVTHSQVENCARNDDPPPIIINPTKMSLNGDDKPNEQSPSSSEEQEKPKSLLLTPRASSSQQLAPIILPPATNTPHLAPSPSPRPLLFTNYFAAPKYLLYQVMEAIKFMTCKELSKTKECVFVAEIIRQAAEKKFPTSSEIWMTSSFYTLSYTSSELKLGDHLRTTMQHLLFRVARLPLPAALSPTERAEQDSAVRLASDALYTLRFGEHPHVTHEDHPSTGTAPLDPIDAVASLSPSITRTSSFTTRTPSLPHTHLHILPIVTPEEHCPVSEHNTSLDKSPVQKINTLGTTVIPPFDTPLSNQSTQLASREFGMPSLTRSASHFFHHSAPVLLRLPLSTLFTLPFSDQIAVLRRLNPTQDRTVISATSMHSVQLPNQTTHQSSPSGALISMSQMSSPLSMSRRHLGHQQKTVHPLFIQHTTSCLSGDTFDTGTNPVASPSLSLTEQSTTCTVHDTSSPATEKEHESTKENETDSARLFVLSSSDITAVTDRLFTPPSFLTTAPHSTAATTSSSSKEAGESDILNSTRSSSVSTEMTTHELDSLFTPHPHTPSGGSVSPPPLTFRPQISTILNTSIVLTVSEDGNIDVLHTMSMNCLSTLSAANAIGAASQTFASIVDLTESVISQRKHISMFTVSSLFYALLPTLHIITRLEQIIFRRDLGVIQVRSQEELVRTSRNMILVGSKKELTFLRNRIVETIHSLDFNRLSRAPPLDDQTSNTPLVPVFDFYRSPSPLRFELPTFPGSLQLRLNTKQSHSARLPFQRVSFKGEKRDIGSISDSNRTKTFDRLRKMSCLLRRTMHRISPHVQLCQKPSRVLDTISLTQTTAISISGSVTFYIRRCLFMEISLDSGSGGSVIDSSTNGLVSIVNSDFGGCSSSDRAGSGTINLQETKITKTGLDFGSHSFIESTGGKVCWARNGGALAIEVSNSATSTITHTSSSTFDATFTNCRAIGEDETLDNPTGKGGAIFVNGSTTNSNPLKFNTSSSDDARFEKNFGGEGNDVFVTSSVFSGKTLSQISSFGGGSHSINFRVVVEGLGMDENEKDEIQNKLLPSPKVSVNGSEPDLYGNPSGKDDAACKWTSSFCATLGHGIQFLTQKGLDGSAIPQTIQFVHNTTYTEKRVVVSDQDVTVTGTSAKSPAQADIVRSLVEIDGAMAVGKRKLFVAKKETKQESLLWSWFPHSDTEEKIFVASEGIDHNNCGLIALPCSSFEKTFLKQNSRTTKLLLNTSSSLSQSHTPQFSSLAIASFSSPTRHTLSVTSSGSFSLTTQSLSIASVDFEKALDSEKLASSLFTLTSSSYLSLSDEKKEQMCCWCDKAIPEHTGPLAILMFGHSEEDVAVDLSIFDHANSGKEKLPSLDLSSFNQLNPKTLDLPFFVSETVRSAAEKKSEGDGTTKPTTNTEERPVATEIGTERIRLKSRDMFKGTVFPFVDQLIHPLTSTTKLRNRSKTGWTVLLLSHPSRRSLPISTTSHHPMRALSHHVQPNISFIPFSNTIPSLLQYGRTANPTMLCTI
ncbi:hypothetical protein BLNAU_18414 [Blattamonas nauphoetae]|uniref:Uncharacterized protein n=1 Tax=Blattamonas nauphoetae TaxID=2049346 RepID=A0ABQ9X6X3_9EUKA|nr:hypothetical protein BLNAU_18414 [Blattamonas nauphoetae]